METKTDNIGEHKQEDKIEVKQCDFGSCFFRFCGGQNSRCQNWDCDFPGPDIEGERGVVWGGVEGVGERGEVVKLV